MPWLDADPRATLRVAPGDGGIRLVADLLISPDLDAIGRASRSPMGAPVTPHTGIRADDARPRGADLDGGRVAGAALVMSGGSAVPAAGLGGVAGDALPRRGLLVAGWQVRKVRDGRSDGSVSPLRAARTLVLAQAAALTGSVLVGWYLANVLALLPNADVQSQHDRIPPFVLHAVVALLLGGAAWSCSGWCRLRPHDDEDETPPPTS